MLAALLLATTAVAQDAPIGPGRGMHDGGVKNEPSPVLQRVAFEQRLNQQLPLDTVFHDETGRAAPLRTYFGKRPVILALVYYECPMLCTQVLNGLVGTMKMMKFTAGQEFDVVAVSFDARENPQMAAAKKKVYLDSYRRAGAEDGWHFLTGDQAAVDALTSAVGFRYAWDEQTKQFAHASGIMIVTPDGRLAQYYYGIEYSPKDVRLGLVEASQGKIGSLVDQVLLYCYHYNPTTGTYAARALNIVRLGGLATVLVLGGFMLTMFRRERRSQRRSG